MGTLSPGERKSGQRGPSEGAEESICWLLLQFGLVLDRTQEEGRAKAWVVYPPSIMKNIRRAHGFLQW